MKRVISAETMRACDQATIEHIGISSATLMERAALAVTDELCAGAYRMERVLAVCGGGNNGGDGIAAARILHSRGIRAEIFLLGDEEFLTEECARQLNIARNSGVPIIDAPDMTAYSTIIDALFGIGLSREVGGDIADIIEEMNLSGADIVAVDIPSGIAADTGAVMGTAVRAKSTVAFAYAKPGHLLYPGARYCGDVRVADIGVYAGRRDAAMCIQAEPGDLSKLLPPRPADGNKGTFGRVLVIAGSQNMSGAACLAARAAYTAGAGLVEIFTPVCNRVILQTQLPEAILSTYDPETIDFTLLARSVQAADAIVLGPGLGIGHAQAEITSYVLSAAAAPTVIDADALNILARGDLSCLLMKKAPLAITPHPGEMARLTGRTVNEVTADMLGSASGFAAKYDLVCHLKNAASVTAEPDGRTVITAAGNSGMATAGSGDVLAGTIGALAAQGLPIAQAVYTGALLHGMGGTRAAGMIGRRSLMASNIIEGMAHVLHDCDE